MVLRSGLVAAEQFVGTQPSWTTALVSQGTRTYARTSGKSCWTALPRSSDQSFENLGLPFPDQPGMSVQAPVRTPTGWNLTIVAEGTPGTLEIDGRSLRVRRLTLTTPQGAKIVEHVTDLASAPSLLKPAPRC